MHNHLGNVEYEEMIAKETLERYSGSSVDEFEPYLLLTNFPKYLEYFSQSRNLEIKKGAMFQVCHNPQEQISFLDFKIGSPAAALVIDLCAHLPIKSTLLLGMCGGLRRHYKVGDFFVPVASIRAEGTSDFYFPTEVPALSNFFMQKMVTNELEEEKINYHIGITHTTNKRFWEFNAEFVERLKKNRAQAIEMECATLFMAGYSHKLPVGALLLISDLPLERQGIKTKQSSQEVFNKYTAVHTELGVNIMKRSHLAIKDEPKGIFRGARKKFAKEYLDQDEYT